MAAVPEITTSTTLAREAVHLDGTTLEGGGQLLRLALALSSISGQAVHVTRIRGSRTAKSVHLKRHKGQNHRHTTASSSTSANAREPSPAGGPPSGPATSANSRGAVGGLNPSLLAATQWLAFATRAEAVGMVAKSTDLTFRPPTSLFWEDSRKSMNSIWRKVYSDDGEGQVELIRKESNIPLDSPGSTSLILQAVLPYLICSAGPTSAIMTGSDAQLIPLRLVIQGGTNVTSSPSFEYLHQVLVPMLNTHVLRHEADIQLKLLSRGWCTGRRDLGRIQCDVIPRSLQGKVPAFCVQDRGELERFHLSILAPSNVAAQKIRLEATNSLLQHWGENIEITFPVYETASGHSTRIYLLIVAETSNRYRLGRDVLYQGPAARKGAAVPDSDSLHRLVATAVELIGRELTHGGCVDEYMQDQLVVFQALAQARSVVQGAEHMGEKYQPSLHTHTARWVVEQMHGLRTQGRR